MGGREIIIIAKTGNSGIIGSSERDSVRTANTVYSSKEMEKIQQENILQQVRKQ